MITLYLFATVANVNSVSAARAGEKVNEYLSVSPTVIVYGELFVAPSFETNVKVSFTPVPVTVTAPSLPYLSMPHHRKKV